MRDILQAIRMGDFEGFFANMHHVVDIGGEAWNHPLVRGVLPLLPRRLVSGFTSEIRRRGGTHASWGKACFHDDENPAEFSVAASTALQALLMSVLQGKVPGKYPARLSSYGLDEDGMRDVIMQMPHLGQMTRHRITDKGQSFIVSDCAGTGRTMLVCMGFSDVPMMDVGVLDAFLAAYGWSAVYLRDHQRSAYQLGVDGKGYEKTLSRIEHSLHGLGTRRLHVFGSSFGSLGALILANALKPARIDLFSPVISASRQRVEEIGDTRGVICMNYLERYCGDLVFDAFDLVGNTLDGSIVNAHVGERMDIDRRQLGLWRGVDFNVRVVDGCSQHNCLVPAMAVQPLEKILGLVV